MNTARELIVITGSSGRIGSRLIGRLAERYDIAALDDGKPPYPAAPAYCIAVDLGSDQSVHDALHQVRIRYDRQQIAAFVHLAAYYDFTGEPSPKYHAVNVLGTERLLRALRSFDVGRFIYSSSMLVHAPQPPSTQITESSPLDPNWDYPKSKLAAEKAIVRECGNVPFAILRIAGVYDDECHLPALAQQIARIYERKLISRVFPGNSSHGQASIHIDDLIDALTALIQKRASLPRHLVMLIGEPQTPSYAQLQHKIGELIHGEPWETREVPKVVAKTGAWLEQIALPKEKEPFIKPWMIDLADDHFALNVSLARASLNWEPTHSLLATLPKMIAALRNDPITWYRNNGLDVPDNLDKDAFFSAPKHRRGT